DATTGSYRNLESFLSCQTRHPLAPRKRGPRVGNREQTALDSRLRGNERPSRSVRCWLISARACAMLGIAPQAARQRPPDQNGISSSRSPPLPPVPAPATAGFLSRAV